MVQRNTTGQVLETYKIDSAMYLPPEKVSVVPSRDAVIRLIDRLFVLLYPGYFGVKADKGLRLKITRVLRDAEKILAAQIFRAVRLTGQLPKACDARDDFAKMSVNRFFEGFAKIRSLLETDVQATLDGDPAATGFDEIVLAYPGFYAVTVYRLAHQLNTLGVPLLPRMMTEYAHQRTGIDLHPAARIGERFFIDHGTGVVVGETTDIGRNVKIYQGVTLGALSFKIDERGRVIREGKRHPTIEDDVVIYAGATILGGKTVIGRGTIVGGNTWVTHSIPPGSRVILEPVEQKIDVIKGVNANENL